MPKLTYVEGDLFSNLGGKDKSIIITHVVNNKGVWGGGFVVPLARSFPSVKSAYQRWEMLEIGDSKDRALYWPNNRFGLGNSQFLCVAPNIVVVNMVAQDNDKEGRFVDYGALVTCMQVVVRAGIPMFDPIIYCPLFGAGIGGGSWHIIEEIIHDVWLKYVDVTAFYFKNDTDRMGLDLDYTWEYNNSKEPIPVLEIPTPDPVDTPTETPPT